MGETFFVDGVVLSVLDFRERDRIATVFTPGGLVKVFVRRRQLPLMEVLTEGEFLLKEGRGDLYRFRDGTILNQHLRLRERFESLEAAGKIVQAILKSQWPGKGAPGLYQLFRYFLEKIPEVERPEDLVTLFLVKTLKHEGVFQVHDHCSVCGKRPFARFGGERFCQKHAPVSAIEISSEEEERLTQMAEGRSLKELLLAPGGMQQSVATLFEQAFIS